MREMKKIINSIFIEKIRENKLILSIEKEYLNNCWLLHFGEIQEELLGLKEGEITVNLCNCEFISPTPFLSLLLTLQYCKEINFCVIKFVLEESNGSETEKFWDYCVNNGFYAIMKKIGAQNEIKEHIRKTGLKDHSNYEKIVEVQIIDIGDSSIVVDDLVSEVINNINQEKIAVNKHNRTYQMVAIRNVLTELLDNVCKHAYDSKLKKKYCILYIRMRVSNKETSEIGKRNNQYTGKETVKPYEVYLQNAIEIYFQDLGQGLITSLENKNRLQKSERPLRKAIQNAFYDFKSLPRKNNTAVTGLKFLGELLANGNNFFSIYDSYEGVGTFTSEAYVEGKYKINTNKISMKDCCANAKPIKGLIYNFTLFDRSSVRPEDYSDYRQSILSMYSEQYRDYNFDVIDYRDEYEIRMSGQHIDKEYVWVFPPPYATKSGIIRHISDALKKVKDKEKMIIADIVDEELSLFKHTLDNTYIYIFDENVKLNEVYLISGHLNFISLKRDGKVFKVVQMAGFNKFNTDYKFLYKLKIYESKKMAYLLESEPVGKYAITKGTVEWNQGDKIKGYINFDFLVSNNETYIILERNLERLNCYWGKGRLYAIDNLTKRLIDTVNLNLDLQGNKYTEDIGVGSVIVSGLTLQSNNYENAENIHFFSRSVEKRQAALFFDPVYLYSDEENDDQYYVREGKSYRIRQGNLEPISVDTHSYVDEITMYQILHEFTYSSILFGHMNFEDRHDLFSLNLKALLFDRNTKLEEFVNQIIYNGLGHYKNVETYNQPLFDVLAYSTLIVYPFNPFTSAVMRSCKAEKIFKEYIWGLTPVNIIHAGETLEYSDNYKECLREKMREFKQQYKDKPLKVIVFDTLSYSGRTRQEIYGFLNSIQQVDVVFVNIIDAKVSHYDKPENEINFMNLNIPLLGTSATCEICTVLERFKLFKESIIDARLIEKIENLTKNWEVRDVRDQKDVIVLKDFKEINAIEFMKNNTRFQINTNITFRNAIPLYLYITNRIKIENDFSIIETFLDKEEKNLDKQSIAYICAVFILEYRMKAYYSILTRVSRALLRVIFAPDSGEDSEIRQLSLLALMNIKEDTLWRIIKNYLLSIEEKSSLLAASNEGLILLLYFIEWIKKEGALNKSNIFYMLMNKYKSGNIRIDLYKQFHCQLININGRIHNSPLKSMTEDEISDRRLKRSSLELLKQSLENHDLKFDILYEDRNKVDHMNSGELIPTCLGFIEEAMDELQKFSYDKTCINNKVTKIYEVCLELHERLFVPFFINRNVQNRQSKDVIAVLFSLIEEHNERQKRTDVIFDQSYEIPMPDNIEAIYYIWNNMLSREIYYILDNVSKYAGEDKRVIIGEEEVSGQVIVQIEEMNFIIRIYNNSETDINDICKKAKQRYQKEVLKMLGIQISYQNNDINSKIFNRNFDENAVVAIIKIPNVYKVERRTHEDISCD